MSHLYDTNREKGAATIFVAVMLVALIGIAAFAVDIGYGLVVRSQLQNVSDTGSLAGARELALIYQEKAGWSTTDSYKYHYLTDTERARVAAKVNSFSQLNKAGGMAITIRTNDDIMWGKYTAATGDLTETSPKYTGVTGIKVTARRDQTNRTIATTLGRVLGINSLSVRASSAATLSSLKVMPAGKGGIPVGISQYWFTSKTSPCATHDKVNHAIRLYPTMSSSGPTTETAQSCAGWHTFTESVASAAKLRDILKGLKTNSYVSPVTQAKVTSYNFIGGTVASDFDEMRVLFNQNAVNGEWKTVVPVYEAADCKNPSGFIKIVGFATVWIYAVNSSPSNTIDATVDCNVVDWGEGGGDDYGTLVGSPGMVQ